MTETQCPAMDVHLHVRLMMSVEMVLRMTLRIVMMETLSLEMAVLQSVRLTMSVETIQLMNLKNAMMEPESQTMDAQATVSSKKDGTAQSTHVCLYVMMLF